MRDEWEGSPSVPRPCYPIRFGKEGCGPNGRLSAQELYRENKRIDDRCTEIRRTYELACDEARRQWPLKRIELIRKRLAFLRRCRRMSPKQRRGLLNDCVYLMWCPTLGVYKIGRTDNAGRRIGELRYEIDPAVERISTYRTTVSISLLETLLHQHYSHFRFASDVSDELFALPAEEVREFEATVASIEKHLLAIEFIRLRKRLAQLEAEVQIEPAITDGRASGRIEQAQAANPA
jgi:Meiotically up-regulated gene 113